MCFVMLYCTTKKPVNLGVVWSVKIKFNLKGEMLGH